MVRVLQMENDPEISDIACHFLSAQPGHAACARIEAERGQESDFSLGPFALDDACSQATLHGEPLRLSQMEYRLLSWFLHHPRTYATAEEIYQALWGKDASGDPRTVQVHIHNLRRKIEADPSQPRYLQCAWGKGYVFFPTAEPDMRHPR